MPKTITRFAPSPTGYLHLGHAYSALMAYAFVAKRGGDFILRLEDIDITRCLPAYTEAIYEDLRWLGMAWVDPVWQQSKRMDIYQSYLNILTEQGLTYPCFCSRKDIADANSAPHGPEGIVYPGTCRHLSDVAVKTLLADEKPHAIRLKMDQALEMITAPLIWQEGDTIEVADPAQFGDIVLARKDIPTSYHLSVVVDDGLQNITDIIRSDDLRHATAIHRLLQELLSFPAPHYHHHALLTDETGKRFAKRDKALTLKSLRESGYSPDDILEMINHSLQSSTRGV